MLLNNYRSRAHASGADPGINYEGRVGVHKSMNFNYKGRKGLHKSIALSNKVHEVGVHMPPVPPPASATVLERSCIAGQQIGLHSSGRHLFMVL